MSGTPGRFMSQVAAAAGAGTTVSAPTVEPKLSSKTNWVVIFAVVVLGAALIYLITKCRKIDSKVKKLETQQRTAMDNSDVENIVGHVLAQTENQRQIQTAKIAQGVTDHSIGQLLGFLQERGVIAAPKKESPPPPPPTATVEEIKKEDEEEKKVEQQEEMYDSDSEGDAASRVHLPKPPPPEDPSSAEFKSLLKTSSEK